MAHVLKSQTLIDSKENLTSEDRVQRAKDILNRYGLDECKTRTERIEIDVEYDNINTYIDYLLNGLFKDLSVDYKEKVASIQVTKNEQFYQFEIVDEKKDSFSIYSIKSIRSKNKFNISIYGYRRDVKLNCYSRVKRSIFSSKNDLILGQLLKIFENQTQKLLIFLLYDSFNKEN